VEPKVVARAARKVYPSLAGDVPAIVDFDLEVREGEFVCLVGPSGCGKSTFLRILAGLDSLSGGEAYIVPGPDPSRPLNNVVFQEYAVFPWKTVRDNVAFGLQMRGVPRDERYQVADRWLAKVGLKRFADYYPAQISGGMKQRVSIARALANDPQVLLMDEPLGALDAQTRAVLLGDRVVLMTAHPGTKKAEFVVDLPRPRDLTTTQSPRFAELTGAIWAELKDEVRRAMEAQA